MPKITGRGALACVLAVTGLSAQARPPREPSRKALLAFAYPPGPMSPAQLNTFFDAARSRPALESAVKGAAGGAALPKAPAPADSRPAAARLHQELVVPVPRETPAYRRTFRAMLSQPDKTDRWDELILRYARIFRLDSRLLKSIMAAESEFDPKALSPAGARGLMQVMPATAEEMGVSARRLHEPAAGVKAGAAYLQNLFKAAWRLFRLKGVRYTDAPRWVIQRVIAAYHAGPQFLTRLNLFPSTRAYVRKVVLFYQSKVTDLRRPTRAVLDLPAYAETVGASGALH